MKKKVLSTEEQIKVAASKLFLERGFDGTTTRDIAAAANVNVALINYYYRSKQRLYEIIVDESVSEFFNQVMPIFDDPETTLSRKIELIVDAYTDFFSANPEIPMFLFNEIRRNPKALAPIIPLDKMMNTKLVEQAQEKYGEKLGMVPYFGHMMMNAFGMLVTPLFVSPIAKDVIGFDSKAVNEVIETRKRLIPIWIHAMAELAE